MTEPSTRFQLVGIPLSLERTIKDCRDLDAELAILKSTVAAQAKLIEELQKKVG